MVRLVCEHCGNEWQVPGQILSPSWAARWRKFRRAFAHAPRYGPGADAKSRALRLLRPRAADVRSRAQREELFATASIPLFGLATAKPWKLSLGGYRVGKNVLVLELRHTLPGSPSSFVSIEVSRGVWSQDTTTTDLARGLSHSLPLSDATTAPANLWRPLTIKIEGVPTEFEVFHSAADWLACCVRDGVPIILRGRNFDPSLVEITRIRALDAYLQGSDAAD